MICINIPEGVYTMKAKRSIIKSNALAYRKASKAEKEEIHLKAFIIHNQSWLFWWATKTNPFEPHFHKVFGKIGYTDFLFLSRRD